MAKPRPSYVPAQVGYDASYVARAARAGTLDGFHGYPEQDHRGMDPEDTEAYKAAYAKAKEEDRALVWKDR